MTAQHLFASNDKVICGFYEIYNGQLYDLINKNNKLVLREDSSGQLNVVGLVEVEINSIAQLRKTIEAAQANRHIGITSFNKSSSRSHAVIQFKVPNLPLTVNQGQQIVVKSVNSSNNMVRSKVNSGMHKSNSATLKPYRILFIDLAGSERGIDAQNNQMDNRKEGAEINQSLLAVIFLKLYL
jgi:kinesin family protein 2/24